MAKETFHGHFFEMVNDKEAQRGNILSRLIGNEGLLGTKLGSGTWTLEQRKYKLMEQCCKDEGSGSRKAVRMAE